MAALKKKKLPTKVGIPTRKVGTIKKPKKISIKKKLVKKTTPKKKLKKTSIKKSQPKTTKKSATTLSRSTKNPIITPREHKHWESKATFNPTAIYHDGKVHIIYRAIGDNDVSVLGYAKSEDGHSIIEDSKELAFYDMGKPRAQKIDRKKIPKILYSSGGGWAGGCEDPRLTLLDGTVYMIYTAFDGWGSVRMALTSITLSDFLKGNFDWAEPVLISPPGEIHKNWVLFPEKIKGKYAILHSISPKIMIDYFDSLDELDGDNFIYSIHQNNPLWQARDKFIRGVGPSPIKTKYGWLVLYHKMDKHETHRYKLWAMILDVKDPTKILYNSNAPILEPDEWYENEGYKSGVVYSCGAIVKDGYLFVYYGGADKVSCVATANLDKFLKELVSSSVTPLKGKRIKS